MTLTALDFVLAEWIFISAFMVPNSRVTNSSDDTPYLIVVLISTSKNLYYCTDLDLVFVYL